MGKRSDFEKRERDYYRTPLEPIKPLIPYLLGQTYAEPCLGGGDLIRGIGHYTFRLPNKPLCKWASDIQPDTPRLTAHKFSMPVHVGDALKITATDLHGIDLIVTNPPFTWNLLRKLLAHWISLKPTWLLLPSDMANNVRFSQFMKCCSDIIPVGRISWMENGQSGMENYSWYLFDAAWDRGYTRAWPR